MKTEDKLAIHELLSRAAYGLDGHNIDIIESCFAPEANMIVRIDGQDDVGPFEGRDAIMGLMSGAIEVQTDKRRHLITNIFFEAEGDAAADVVSNLTLFHTENGENGLITTGCYHDKVIKLDGVWLIANRDLSLDMPFG